MSCCDNKPDGCNQGRNCELHNALAEQRVERINRWIISNYLLISNSTAIAIAFFVAYIWLSK